MTVALSTSRPESLEQPLPKAPVPRFIAKQKRLYRVLLRWMAPRTASLTGINAFFKLLFWFLFIYKKAKAHRFSLAVAGLGIMRNTGEVMPHLLELQDVETNGRNRRSPKRRNHGGYHFFASQSIACSLFFPFPFTRCNSRIGGTNSAHSPRRLLHWMTDMPHWRMRPLARSPARLRSSRYLSFTEAPRRSSLNVRGIEQDSCQSGPLSRMSPCCSKCDGVHPNGRSVLLCVPGVKAEKDLGTILRRCSVGAQDKPIYATYPIELATFGVGQVHHHELLFLFGDVLQ